jgi:Flp pilus assembly protein TadG
MKPLKNDRGAVLIFVTMMVMLLMIMVGMGLDTGYLTYSRGMGQSAVDAAALAAVSGLPSGSASEVVSRASSFVGSNTYVNSTKNTIGASNITYVSYNDKTGAITYMPSITGANGVRVSLEKSNPYSGAATGNAIQTPAFLTPIMRLMGNNAQSSNDVSVSAVAALTALPGLPIAVMEKMCPAGGAKSGPINLLTAQAKTNNSCWTTYTDNPVDAPKVKALFQASETCQGLPGIQAPITIGTDIHLHNAVAGYDDAEDLFVKDKPGRCWYVPVIPDSTSCKISDTIVDWAKICPTAVVTTPGKITTTVQCQQSLFAVQDNLCFSSRLLRDTKSGM